MRSSNRNRAQQDSPHERLLCQILRGESGVWPASPGADLERHFLEACLQHGLTPLVYDKLRKLPEWHDWPAAVREPLAREARMTTALDILQTQELIAVLEAFAAAGIGMLLLKGASLGYSLYAESALRPRCDTDVLIAPASRKAAVCVLEARGYRRRHAIHGSRISYADCYSKTAGNVGYALDIHWRINNSQAFARALGYEELYARSIPVPELSSSARALCAPDAMLVACMHRAAHLDADRQGGNRLIWLYDIHLLANAMTPDEWRQFGELCVAKRMRGVTLDAFSRTHQMLATVFPDDVIDQLAMPTTGEVSAAYLNATRWRVLVTDLRSLATWGERATLLREWCFPPADYLLAKYRAKNRWLLPWWYLRRAMAGVWKLSPF